MKKIKKLISILLGALLLTTPVKMPFIKVYNTSIAQAGNMTSCFNDEDLPDQKETSNFSMGVSINSNKVGGSKQDKSMKKEGTIGFFARRDVVEIQTNNSNQNNSDDLLNRRADRVTSPSNEFKMPEAYTLKSPTSEQSRLRSIHNSGDLGSRKNSAHSAFEYQ